MNNTVMLCGGPMDGERITFSHEIPYMLVTTSPLPLPCIIREPWEQLIIADMPKRIRYVRPTRNALVMYPEGW